MCMRKYGAYFIPTIAACNCFEKTHNSFSKSLTTYVLSDAFHTEDMWTHWYGSACSDVVAVVYALTWAALARVLNINIGGQSLTRRHVWLSWAQWIFCYLVLTAAHTVTYTYSSANFSITRMYTVANVTDCCMSGTAADSGLSATSELLVADGHHSITKICTYVSNLQWWTCTALETLFARCCLSCSWSDQLCCRSADNQGDASCEAAMYNIHRWHHDLHTVMHVFIWKQKRTMHQWGKDWGVLGFPEEHCLIKLQVSICLSFYFK